MNKDALNSQTKSDFAILCKHYRYQNRLKLREVAAIIDVKPSTYGNVESSSHKIISDAKAVILADHYKLTGDERARFLAASVACPLSQYSQKQRDHWKKMNDRRSRAKLSFRLEASLISMIGLLLVESMEPDKLCICEFDVCELCQALDALGHPGRFTNAADLGSWLSTRQQLLDKQREALAKKTDSVIPSGA